jgi:hypothetical protein
MIEFQQYMSHPHTQRHSNILCEDMPTITWSLIRGFLQTRSVDAINRVSFSHKALGIGELHYLLS